MHNPIIIEPNPEKIPFSKTICIGSFEDNFLVQLFSTSQQRHADKINNEPYEKRKLSKSSNDSSKQDNVTNAIPAQSLELIFSLNIIRAIIAVATISKLFKSDALADE